MTPIKMFVLALAVVVAAPAWLAAQVLSIERPGAGIELIVVTVPLADATTLAWPAPDGTIATRISGSLTLAADLGELLGSATADAEPPPLPAAVVAVGQATPEALRSAIAARAGRSPAAAPPVPGDRPPVDGAIERRLGPPGGAAVVRLEIALPAAADWRRTPAEVLWRLVPRLVPDPVVVTRIEGERAVLETRTEAEIVDLAVRRLRTALARIAERPELDADLVEQAARTVAVQRRAILGQHPEGAAGVLGAWLRGRDAGVRQLLFGAEAVTAPAVETVAREWLGSHPGQAVVSIPPRVLNPRFAQPPVRTQLDNDLAVAVLERPTADLAAVVLRPVLSPDVDGEIAATVLARIAAELRTGPTGAGWVWIRTHPARLEAASSADGFAELLEGLQSALEQIAGDDAPVGGDDANSRRRALSLLGGLLGLAGEGGVVPSSLLRPDNLALGVVAGDREAVVEALRKFRFGGLPRPPAVTAPVSDRTRVAARGGRSTLAVVLPVVGGDGDPEVRAPVLAELLRERAPRIAPSLEVEALRPLVPGRTVVVLTVTRDGALDRLESELDAVWPAWLARPTDDEVAAIRRRIAAADAAAGSGVVGRARLCAEMAAGGGPWREPSEREMAALTVAVVELDRDLERWRDLDRLVSAGAGVIPIEGLPGAGGSTLP